VNIYTYEKIVYHIQDTSPGSYSTFIVKYNRINIISYNNKIFKTFLLTHLLQKKTELLIFFCFPYI